MKDIEDIKKQLDIYIDRDAKLNDGYGDDWLIEASIILDKYIKNEKKWREKNEN